MRTTVHLPSSEACKLQSRRDDAPAAPAVTTAGPRPTPTHTASRRAAVRRLVGFAIG
jgi:hypothetical protein